MGNRPEYLAIWLGITSVGGVVSLLNANLPGPSLAHCINVVSPKHLIVSAELAGELGALLPRLSSVPTVWIHGCNHDTYRRIDEEIEQQSGEPLSEHERRPPTIEDRRSSSIRRGRLGCPRPLISAMPASCSGAIGSPA